jgi:hypothetical protein
MEQDITQPGAGLSRRGLVRGATGVAAVGAVAFAASRTPAQAAVGAQNVPQSAIAAQTMDACAADDVVGTEIVVHVRDLRTGELDIFRGTTHRRIHDRDLAARLAAAAY